MDKSIIPLYGMCDGNPGSLRVLIELMKDTDDDFFNAFVMAFNNSKSSPSSLWMVYNDECDHDLNATKAMIKEWFTTSPHQPLEIWLTESF